VFILEEKKKKEFLERSESFFLEGGRKTPFETTPAVKVQALICKAWSCKSTKSK
jgi:hypothetical protein